MANLDTNSQIAIEAIHRALSRFAQVYSLPPITDEVQVDDALISAAQSLALPTQNDDSVPPALHSVMGNLLANDPSQSGFRYYLPQSLPSGERDFSTVIIPTSDLNDIATQRRNLWQQFQVDYAAQFDRQKPLHIQVSVLYGLLQRYGWSLPAPIVGSNDVSLFDFARTSAALAVCMQSTGTETDNPALLVGADLSGVQEFLYTLSSDGAAKSLRGRSVYLQLLMEVIALDFLQNLNLPMVNLLYVGGGNFYLLAPPNQQQQIARYQQQCSRRLLAMHEGALYLTLDVTPLQASELTQQSVGAAWARVSKKLNHQKARRFAELDSEELVAQAIGTPLAGTGLPERQCRVCQRSIPEGEPVFKVTDNDVNPQERKCALCKSFDELGSRLSKANFLSLVRVSADDRTSTEETVANSIASWEEGLDHFSFTVRFDQSAGQLKQQLESFQQIDCAYCYFWHTMPRFDEWQEKSNVVWFYRPLAQCVPLNDVEATETFDILADNSDGVKRWGVLRMDVDRLGEIFREGMQPNASLSRVASLSGLMRTFFEGYVPQIARDINTKAGKSCLHLMYAGGDDLFVVGSWSYLPLLAAELRRAFADFACHNPKVTLSGGISIAPATKYPLYQAANDAHRAEERAKHYGPRSDGTYEKNALTFLEETLSWHEQEDVQPAKGANRPPYDSYDWVWQRVRDLRSWTDGEDAPLPRGFLMSLQALYAEWWEWTRQEQEIRQQDMRRYDHLHNNGLYLGPWQWHLVYSLKRAAQRAKTQNEDKKKLKTAIDAMIKDLISGEIKTIGVSTRWVELLTREEG